MTSNMSIYRRLYALAVSVSITGGRVSGEAAPAALGLRRAALGAQLRPCAGARGARPHRPPIALQPA